MVKNKLLHRYFLLCDWCYWLASAGLFAILWFTVFQNTLLAASAISLELFQKLWKCILIQYPKKFSKKTLIPKNVSAGWKMKSNIFSTSFPYLEKRFKVLENGVHTNLTLIFLWPKIGHWGLRWKEKHFLDLVITERCSFLHLESLLFRKQLLKIFSWEYYIFWPRLECKSLAF